MERELEILGRRVVITEGAMPHDATLTIDGTSIPLEYHDGFGGWGVSHTIYGFFSDLERLAEHMIVSNPRLIIGHGGGHHGGGHNE